MIAVEVNSAADKAGLIEGDVIIGFDDQMIKSIDDLHQCLTQEKVRKSCRLTVIRHFERTILNIIPEESL